MIFWSPIIVETNLPTDIYFFKVNNGNIRGMREIYLKIIDVVVDVA